MSIRIVHDPERPDALQRSAPPLDQNGEPMTAGRHYLIDNDRKLCFEDPDSGDLFYQSVDSDGKVKQRHGVPVRPIPVLSMPSGDYKVLRLEDNE